MLGCARMAEGSSQQELNERRWLLSPFDLVVCQRQPSQPFFALSLSLSVCHGCRGAGWLTPGALPPRRRGAVSRKSHTGGPMYRMYTAPELWDHLEALH